jgi:GT2 family glycosyltransferase
LEKILLVVPIHNRLIELKELLFSLRLLNLESLELSIVIVDDASHEPVPKNLKDDFPDLKLDVIRSDVNIGPARARNLALKNSQAEFFWFLDSDTEIDNPQVLKTMVGVLRNNHEIGAVGGVVEEVDGEWKVFELVFFLNTLSIPQYFQRRDYPVNFVSVLPTANLLVSRNAFDLTGSFDEKLPRNEDTDLCLALKRNKLKIMQSESTLVKHKLSRSGRDSGAFAHFQGSNKFIADLLKARSILLYKYCCWKLFILPVLDLLTIFELFFKSKKNNLKPIRFKMVKEKGKFASFMTLSFWSAYYYFYGLFLSMRIKAK